MAIEDISKKFTILCKQCRSKQCRSKDIKIYTEYPDGVVLYCKNCKNKWDNYTEVEE